jgi:hypothetical protein
MPLRTLLIEPLKALSDDFVGWLLRAGSRFGSELTQVGAQEQRLWRDRRLRDLRGLALRAAQRQREKEPAGR